MGILLAALVNEPKIEMLRLLIDNGADPDSNEYHDRSIIYYYDGSPPKVTPEKQTVVDFAKLERTAKIICDIKPYQPLTPCDHQMEIVEYLKCYTKVLSVLRHCYDGCVKGVRKCKTANEKNCCNCEILGKMAPPYPYDCPNHQIVPCDN